MDILQTRTTIFLTLDTKHIPLQKWQPFFVVLLWDVWMCQFFASWVLVFMSGIFALWFLTDMWFHWSLLDMYTNVFYRNEFITCNYRYYFYMIPTNICMYIPIIFGKSEYLDDLLKMYSNLNNSIQNVFFAKCDLISILMFYICNRWVLH